MTIEQAMNPTIGEAIQRLEGMIFTADFSPNTLRAIAVNKLALAALREQAEREKGCEYCLQGEDLAYGQDSVQRTGRIYLDGNLLTADLYTDSMAVAVCFCPMCGRKLEGSESHAKAD